MCRMRQTTEPVGDLLERLGAPQGSFRCVHVAGTKGKGSVASLIEMGLRNSGASVGVYGSPHVVSIHERIRIAGQLWTPRRAPPAMEGWPARPPGSTS